MLTARLRYSGLGLLLLVVTAALVTAWLRLNHEMFAVVASLLAFFLLLLVVAWDGLRQSSPASLTSRGIYPDSYRSLGVMDPGLRREFHWAPITPPTFSRRRSRTRLRLQAVPSATNTRPRAAPSATPTRPQGVPAVVRTKSARNGQARRRNGVLQPDATISLAAERQAAGIDDLFIELDLELVGLVPVKKKVEEVASLLLVDRARQRFGLSAARPNLHMCFTGAPGTGKTTVALKMADLLHRLGYLEKNRVVHAMRDDLVGEYIGHTAPKTKQVLSHAMGGVLFIDEAYSLYRAADSKDYGIECIDILMQVMENERDNLVVILAGYKDRMDHFFESNPGMSSRIAHHLDFAAYEPDELLAIGGLMLGRSSYYLSAEAVAAFRDDLALQMKEPRFAYARSVRNALEAARLRHAYRLAGEPERHWSKDDLMRLEPEDVVPSR
jgi:probable Rubsico expression protein CbbX